MASVEDILQLTQALKNSYNISKISHTIMTGLSVQVLKEFVVSQKEPEVKKLRELITKLGKSTNERESEDLLFDIYEETFKNLPVTSKTELFFFVKFISILALLKHPLQPQPPLNLFRKLFYSIENHLITDKLIQSIANKMFSISTDHGDVTHLSMQCAHLDLQWDPLVIKLSWLSLVRLSNATERLSTKNINLSRLQELLTEYHEPDSVRNLLLTVHLVSLLVNKLSSKESESSQESLDSIRDWLNMQSIHIDSYTTSGNDIMSNIETLPVRSFITNVLVNWPELKQTNNYEGFHHRE